MPVIRESLFFGSNSLSAYTNTANDILNMTLLHTIEMVSTINSTISISSVIAYRYYIIKIVSGNAGYSCTCNSVRYQKKAGGYNNLLLNTNYNIINRTSKNNVFRCNNR